MAPPLKMHNRTKKTPADGDAAEKQNDASDSDDQPTKPNKHAKHAHRNRSFVRWLLRNCSQSLIAAILIAASLLLVLYLREKIAVLHESETQSTTDLTHLQGYDNTTWRDILTSTAGRLSVDIFSMPCNIEANVTVNEVQLNHTTSSITVLPPASVGTLYNVHYDTLTYPGLLYPNPGIDCQHSRVVNVYGIIYLGNVTITLHQAITDDVYYPTTTTQVLSGDETFVFMTLPNFAARFLRISINGPSIIQTSLTIVCK